MIDPVFIIGGLLVVMVLLITVKIGNITINIGSNNGNGKDDTK